MKPKDNAAAMAEVNNARALSLEILLLRERSFQPVDQLLDQELARLHDPRDRQLATALTLGVLRWQGYLDRILAGLSRHPLERMKPLTLNVLRLGCFQLLFMDRIPAAAAVNESVNLLKSRNQPRWLTGFVNGVLRAVDRNRQTFPPPGSDEASFLSHPEWLVLRWRARYGDHLAAHICRANNQPPVLTLRLAPGVSRDALISRFAAHGIEARPGRYTERSVVVEKPAGQVADLPGYREGLFSVQDEAAQLVVHLFGDPAGAFLDACAGLGGKTLQLAELLKDRGKVTAVEPHGPRRRQLVENLTRLGLEAEIFAGTLEEFAATSPGRYNGILLDAPCSGTGVIRRHPDIRWNRTPEDLARYQERQVSLLACAAKLLDQGGVLVYATCSLEPEENQEVVERFLRQFPAFAREEVAPYLPEAAREFGRDGWLTTLPCHGLDGFFAARLKKSE